MPFKSAILVAATVGLSVTAALADEPAEKAGKQPRVCRQAEKTLGSHIRTTRRCRTAEQWQEEDAKSGLPVGAQVTPGQNDGQVGRQPQ